MKESVTSIDRRRLACDSQLDDRRVMGDRRTVSFKTAVSSTYKQRRKKMQRTVDRQKPNYIDVYDARLFSMIMLIILLCIADAYFTLIILSNGGTEINPIMERLLAIGPKTFFYGKYLLTSAALFIAVLHANFIFLKRFRVRSLLSGFSLLYLLLIIYELKLMSMGTQ